MVSDIAGFWLHRWQTGTYRPILSNHPNIRPGSTVYLTPQIGR